MARAPVVEEIKGRRRNEFGATITADFTWDPKCCKDATEARTKAFGARGFAAVVNLEELLPAGQTISNDEVILAVQFEIVREYHLKWYLWYLGCDVV